MAGSDIVWVLFENKQCDIKTEISQLTAENLISAVSKNIQEYWKTNLETQRQIQTDSFSHMRVCSTREVQSDGGEIGIPRISVGEFLFGKEKRPLYFETEKQPPKPKSACQAALEDASKDEKKNTTDNDWIISKVSCSEAASSSLVDLAQLLEDGIFSITRGIFDLPYSLVQKWNGVFPTTDSILCCYHSPETKSLSFLWHSAELHPVTAAAETARIHLLSYFVCSYGICLHQLLERSKNPMVSVFVQLLIPTENNQIGYRNVEIIYDKRFVRMLERVEHQLFKDAQSSLLASPSSLCDKAESARLDCTAQLVVNSVRFKPQTLIKAISFLRPPLHSRLSMCLTIDEPSFTLACVVKNSELSGGSTVLRPLDVLHSVNQNLLSLSSFMLVS